MLQIDDFVIDSISDTEWYIYLEDYNEDRDIYLIENKLQLWNYDTGRYTSKAKAETALIRFLKPPSNIEEDDQQ